MAVLLVATLWMWFSQPTLESVPQPTELRLANFSLTQLVSDPGSCTGCCKYLWDIKKGQVLRRVHSNHKGMLPVAHPFLLIIMPLGTQAHGCLMAWHKILRIYPKELYEKKTRFSSCLPICDKTKGIFLNFITELKTLPSFLCYLITKHFQHHWSWLHAGCMSYNYKLNCVVFLGKTLRLSSRLFGYVVGS